MNKCTDAIRSCENETDSRNINSNVCTRHFTKLLKEKGWKFNEVYVDTVRMQKTYVADNFGKNFFDTLCTMAGEGLLGNTLDCKGKVYLPFNPHFFVHVNASINITQRYDISYIRESEVDGSNHKLAHSSNNNDDFASMHKSMIDENRHITTKRAEILNYSNGYLLTNSRVDELLAPLGNVHELRYILLTCLSPTINSNTLTYDYSSILINPTCNNSMNYFRSKLCTSGSSKYLAFLGRKVLYKLVNSQFDSLHGISLVADAPECNKKAKLNVTRAGVLRQYYGLDLGLVDKNRMKRVAYRSHSATSSEGSDPKKLVIKPFSCELSEMAKFYINFLY